MGDSPNHSSLPVKSVPGFCPVGLPKHCLPRLEANRLTPEKIDTPKAVFHVANESEPGRAIATGFRSIVFDEDASNDMLVDLDAKRLGYDRCDPWTAEVCIAALEFNDGTNKFIGRTFRSRFRFLLRREEPVILTV